MQQNTKYPNMKTKNLILNLFLFVVTPTIVFPQSLDKEVQAIQELASNPESHIFIDFLTEKFDYTQEIGLGESESRYDEIKGKSQLDASGNIAIKKNPYFSGVKYGGTNDILNYIRLAFPYDKFSAIRQILTDTFGAPDTESAGMQQPQSIYYVPGKYYITLSQNNRYLNIAALDFIPNETEYDETTQTAITYVPQTPVRRPDPIQYIKQNFAYSYNTDNGSNGFAIKTYYCGKGWFNMEKIIFQLDNGEEITIDAHPEKNTEQLITSTNFIENDITAVSAETLGKLLNASTVKVTVTGENGKTLSFDLTPLHKYQMTVAKYYFDNQLQIK